MFFVLALLAIASTDALLPILNPDGSAVQLRGCTEEQKDAETARGSPWCKITSIEYDTKTAGSDDCADAQTPDVKTTECRPLSSGKYKRYECLPVDGESTYRYYYNTYSNQLQCEQAGTLGSVFEPEVVDSSATVVFDGAAPKCAANSATTGVNIDCSRALPAPPCTFDVSTVGPGGLAGGCSSTVDAGDECIPTCRTGYRIPDDGKFVCGFGAPKNGTYEGEFTGTTQCVENVCVCNNGDVTGTCTVHGADECKQDGCNSGYHAEQTGNSTGVFQCKVNLCTCANGTPVDSASCTQHEANKCKAWDDAYVLSDDGTCEAPDRLNPDNAPAPAAATSAALGASSLLVSASAMLHVWHFGL